MCRKSIIYIGTKLNLLWHFPYSYLGWDPCHFGLLWPPVAIAGQLGLAVHFYSMPRSSLLILVPVEWQWLQSKHTAVKTKLLKWLQQVQSRTGEMVAILHWFHLKKYCLCGAVVAYCTNLFNASAFMGNWINLSLQLLCKEWRLCPRIFIAEKSGIEIKWDEVSTLHTSETVPQPYCDQNYVTVLVTFSPHSKLMVEEQ